MNIRSNDSSGGLPLIILMESGGSSTVEVLLYGGQVISWKNERREELLFMSSKAVRKPPKAIRGGLPICFPQFGNLGSLEQHGFARTRLWELDPNPSPLSPVNNLSSVDLILKSTEEDLKTWPRSFELRLRISLSAGKLTLIPRVRNVDSKPFSFTFAIRNYFSVSDISEVRVEGLETLDYFDNMMKRERFTEQSDAITFDGEVDRVYLSTPTKIAIIDHEKKRTFVLRKEGFPDADKLATFDNKEVRVGIVGKKRFDDTDILSAPNQVSYRIPTTDVLLQKAGGAGKSGGETWLTCVNSRKALMELSSKEEVERLLKAPRIEYQHAKLNLRRVLPEIDDLHFGKLGVEGDGLNPGSTQETHQTRSYAEVAANDRESQISRNPQDHSISCSLGFMLMRSVKFKIQIQIQMELELLKGARIDRSIMDLLEEGMIPGDRPKEL
ncbi:hypothetical protein IFM89_003087 [Coptis chinensis]|uniref:glucose-6-phosphate 1-epimerase n=1 Tax=Coptis chinensis TaxID=261450 RepID=A0A835I6T8_9MAGN|nr:hypothetical protein IFM89_003087 [Coptis chinensis]